MALTLLASQNEPYWGEPKNNYVTKNPNSNPKIYPNPNPNPNPGGFPQIHASGRMQLDEPTTSDNSSCFDRARPSDRDNNNSAAAAAGYVRFKISAYSKAQLRDLKRRLTAELHQVRSLRSRVESTTFRSDPTPDEIKRTEAVTSSSSLASLNPELRKMHTAMMRKCSQILTKLMKHKSGVWFNTPVDAAGMGLHDYHYIIKNPMDLGTVKDKLKKGLYPTPVEFADDIRLTFNNALVYNPMGHDVHSFAELLLRQFEGSFGPAYSKFEKQQGLILREEEERRQKAASWARVVPMPDSLIKAEAAAAPLVPPKQQQPLAPPKQEPRVSKQAARPKMRAMSMEEKQNLGAAIQNLPEDKMNAVLEIVSKRNETSKDGDEIEIDFEVMDNETLWELDRFVVNFHKMLNKAKKRQQEAMATNGHSSEDAAFATAAHLLPSDAGHKSPVAAGETPEALEAKKSSKRGDPVDEDVDIGDDMPATQYPSVEIEKKESSSSSSGSSSGSSSSSDSDSDSSSDSDSGDDREAGSRQEAKKT